MAKTKTRSTSVVKKPKIVPAGAKTRKKPQYKSFRPHKRIKHHAPKLPNWWVLFKKSLLLIKQNKKAILIFFLIYGSLNVILVRGIAPIIDVEGIKENYNELGLEISGVETGFTAFGNLLNASAQNVDNVAQLYQITLLIIASLALVWLYRQQQAGNKVTMKMAFYRGMYPLIPFSLLVCLIGVQLIPATIGNFLFSTVTANGLVVGFLEQAAWFLLFVFTLLLSFYLICGTLIALFVVTLPEMTPMRALHEAKELVRYRRLPVLSRIFALLLIMIAIVAIVVLPLIFFNALLAEWVFFAITVLAVPFIVGYLFSLYRELL